MHPTAPTQSIALAPLADLLERSLLRQLVRVVSQPGITSFAGGLPDPALFPATEYAAALQHAIAADARALQYGPPHAGLLAHLAALMARRGTSADPAQLILTTGAQQALNLLAQLLVPTGGTVMLEPAIYTGILQAIRPLQPRIVPIPTDLADGLDVDAVARACARGDVPSLLYTIPDGHNPTGVSMSDEKRHALVALAQRYGFAVVEDDPYGLLYYGDGAPRRPLHALAPSHVFYVGSLSKVVAPAVRTGWIAPPAPFVEKVTILKEAADLENPQLTQRALARLFDTLDFDAHLGRLRTTYRSRRDALLAALDRSFPADAHWSQPDSGMFVWVNFDRDLDALTLLETAVTEHRLAFVPGRAFAATPDAARGTLRLTFVALEEAAIGRGISELATVLEKKGKREKGKGKNTVPPMPR